MALGYQYEFRSPKTMPACLIPEVSGPIGKCTSMLRLQQQARDTCKPNHVVCHPYWDVQVHKQRLAQTRMVKEESSSHRAICFIIGKSAHEERMVICRTLQLAALVF